MKFIPCLRDLLLGYLPEIAVTDSKAIVGKIYYRTGVAFRELGDRTQARRLLRVANVYLPRDENVKRELAQCALRLG